MCAEPIRLLNGALRDVVCLFLGDVEDLLNPSAESGEVGAIRLGVGFVKRLAKLMVVGNKESSSTSVYSFSIYCIVHTIEKGGPVRVGPNLWGVRRPSNVPRPLASAIRTG